MAEVLGLKLDMSSPIVDESGKATAYFESFLFRLAQKPLIGSGAPALVADIGRFYVDSAGGVGTTVYIKQSGTGTSSGWVLV